MGWEDMKQDKVQEAKQNDLILQRQKKFMSLIYSTFKTQEGKELLEMLSEDFLMSSVSDPRQDANFGFWREGQNSIIRTFVNAVKHFTSEVEVTNAAPKEKAENKGADAKIDPIISGVSSPMDLSKTEVADE